ncbi:MAG: cytochrome b/b6 domain-containing protein [Betaproteobacteria bacterium]|jgi:cytochrome b|nr:cytochrome b/b6 domain-containing protein [Betaproteobacteria bacterium]
MSALLHEQAGVVEPRTVKVWDIAIRAFHWSIALCFAGAWLTAESERYRDIHVLLGYTVLGLVAFRLLWGVVGTRHARFANFVRGPAAVAHYLRTLLSGRPERHLGHNPAGAVAIVAMLSLAALAGLSGWALYEDLGGEWLEETHEFLAGAMLAAVGVHLAGVAVASWLHRENLVRAMLTGRKDDPRATP